VSEKPGIADSKTEQMMAKGKSLHTIRRQGFTNQQVIFLGISSVSFLSKK